MLLATLLMSTTLFGASRGAAPAAAVESFDFEVRAQLDLGISAMSRGIDEGQLGRAAGAFARSYAVRNGGAGTETFEPTSVVADELGQRHVRLQQTISGLRVYGGELIVHSNERGMVIGVNGRFAPDVRLARMPRVSPVDAVDGAAATLDLGNEWSPSGNTELAYLIDDRGSVTLVWSDVIAYSSEEGPELDRIFVDARTGELTDRHPLIHRAKYRKTYTCNNGTTLPGTLLTNEGTRPTDSAAAAAYDNGGITYDYYKVKHNRDSYNNAGATIVQSVHYSSKYNNAFWNGSQMVYGDGDGTTFIALSKSLDVVAHELTHAVTEKTAGLVYKNESGALNESMSDVFGAATEAYARGVVDAKVWKIGEDVYTPATAGDALRYMNDPIADGSSKDYYPTRYVGTSDNGGVHWNSGIANLAFKLLVTGGSHPRSKTSVTVSGIGMARAEKIFYRAHDVYNTSSTNYRVFRSYATRAASDLYGSGSSYVTSVNQAFDAVGNNWTTQTGSISASGGTHTQPYYQTSTTGYQTGHLFGPSSTDYDLYLQKWDGSKWVNVASGTTSSNNEVVQYNGSAAYYRWYVKSYSGTGSYTLYGNRPK